MRAKRSLARQSLLEERCEGRDDFPYEAYSLEIVDDEERSVLYDDDVRLTLWRC